MISLKSPQPHSDIIRNRNKRHTQRSQNTRKSFSNEPNRPTHSQSQQNKGRRRVIDLTELSHGRLQAPLIRAHFVFVTSRQIVAVKSGYYNVHADLVGWVKFV